MKKQRPGHSCDNGINTLLSRFYHMLLLCANEVCLYELYMYLGYIDILCVFL